MIKETLFTDWHFMRWLRLGIGLTIGVDAIQIHQPISGFIAAFFLYQAIFNTGCCGTNSCSVPVDSKSNKIEDVEFEEIK